MKCKKLTIHRCHRFDTKK